jgi:precorrin-2 dehydrogenase / sirohydrochlorin ferrochelatase
MIPIVIDPRLVPIALVGAGESMRRRADWLRQGGAEHLTVFSADAGLEGVVQIARLPLPAELAQFRIAWITGLDPDVAEPIATTAREAGLLVNVEDHMPYCDFHTPALVRRGDLLVSISTAGKSPGLAMRLRAWLESQLTDAWSERLETIARKRNAWRRKPRRLEELVTLTDAVIDHRGWLEPIDRARHSHHGEPAPVLLNPAH